MSPVGRPFAMGSNGTKRTLAIGGTPQMAFRAPVHDVRPSDEPDLSDGLSHGSGFRGLLVTGVPGLLELQRQRCIASGNDPPVDHDVDEVGFELDEEPVEVRDGE